MIALLQRVSEARVTVDEALIGSIGRGLLALVAVERGDGKAQARRLAERIVSYRAFPDRQGRMNLDLGQAGGELLMVSQFTLAADTTRGNRPSFTPAADPDTARRLFECCVAEAEDLLGRVEVGQYGADMQVALVNDGPVTFWLRVEPPATE